MTYEKASSLAARALPCPFCGERLIAHSDHHGSWVGHRDEPGPCIDSTTQLMSEDDLRRWNTRTAPEPPVEDEHERAVREEVQRVFDEAREQAEREPRRGLIIPERFQ